MTIAASEIPKELPAASPKNYEFLREEGLKVIRKLGAETWTDHNDHDPGITILEQLCYVITDLAYRLDYEVTDLLGKDPKTYQELYSPATVMTMSPVTIADFRKLIIDIKGVKNAWLEKYEQTLEGSENKLKGLYRVIVE
ncbi:MAG: hypothetical protein WBA74_13620, partial [Cyclobacteriaceae bacterium]